VAGRFKKDVFQPEFLSKSETFSLAGIPQSPCTVIRGQNVRNVECMTLDEVAKIAKELLGVRCEALITEEFGAPAKFMALLVLNANNSDHRTFIEN
jgi:hypothetical protein